MPRRGLWRGEKEDGRRVGMFAWLLLFFGKIGTGVIGEERGEYLSLRNDVVLKNIGNLDALRSGRIE